MNRRNPSALPSRVFALRNLVRVCAHAALVLILTFFSVGRATAQDSWATKTPDPKAKASAVSGEIDGRIYVYGFDMDASGNQGSFVPRLSIYDPAFNTWTLGTSPGLIRAYSSAGVISGKMYVVGGCLMSDCSNTTNALEIYDPLSNTWSNGASMPTARFGATAGVSGGKLYVTGGELAGYVPTDSTEIYDPTTDSWTLGTPIPTPRMLAMGAVVDGLFYVIGGYERPIGAVVGTVHVYDPILSSWSTRSPMPTFRVGAAVGVIDGHIYVAGGATTEYVAVNESYDPGNDSWTSRTAMPTARVYTTGSVVNSKLYVIGGFGTGLIGLETNEEYSSNLDTTPPVLTVPGNVVAEAEGAAGAIVTFLLPTATDDSGVQSVSCERSSGDTFAIGVTTVQCSASDTAGNIANQAFTVTVQDTTPPVLTLPSNLVTNATSSVGATVVFTFSATDLVEGPRPVVCTPASGSVFVIGLTTVSCSTADTLGNSDAGGFTVTVLSAAQIVADLAAQAAGTDFQAGSNLLQNVLTSIGSGNSDGACQQLDAFINQAQAQAGKKLTITQAEALIAAANSGKAALGCS
jgi:hypothetical protein